MNIISCYAVEDVTLFEMDWEKYIAETLNSEKTMLFATHCSS